MVAMSRPAPRLFVDSPLAPGARIELDGNPAHYLVHVLRLPPGAEVRLFNGTDGEWSAQIETAGKRACVLVVKARTRAQSAPPALTLAFAPLKKSAMDFLIAKATELGATSLRPIVTERTENQRLNLERLAQQAREAAEQCERLDVPDISPPVALTQFLAGWPATQPLWCGDESGAGEPFAQALHGAAAALDAPLGPHGILIGPEGGFTPGELARLAGLAFVRRIDLGPRILRAETAVLAALCCWQALLGDWRRARQ